MKKRLHELIEMAARGEEFQATHENLSNYVNQKYFKVGDFTKEEVVTDWTVRMKREPMIIWLTAYDAEYNGLVLKFKSKEEAEHYGKPIKFIEVIEDEQA